MRKLTMTFRFFLLFLCFFYFLLPLYPPDSFATIYIKNTVYKGSDKQTEKKINTIIKDQFIIHDIFIITENENEAGYILSCIMEKKDDEIIVSMEISGTHLNKIRETVVKRETTINGAEHIIQEMIEYLHRKIFPFEVFSRTNMPFFTVQTTRNNNNDVVDRNRSTNSGSGSIKVQPGDLFVPLNEDSFLHHRFQFFPTCEFSFPLTLMDNDVQQLPYIHLPVYYYLYTSEAFMVSLAAEAHYFITRKEISLNIYNTLHALGGGAGLGSCYILPFYRQVALHLNASAGYMISFLLNTQNTKQISLSFDPYIHPVFEIEHTITEKLSFSIKCSYICVFYINSNYLHLLQSGIGFGYKF